MGKILNLVGAGVIAYAALTSAQEADVKPTGQTPEINRSPMGQMVEQAKAKTDRFYFYENVLGSLEFVPKNQVGQVYNTINDTIPDEWAVVVPVDRAGRSIKQLADIVNMYLENPNIKVAYLSENGIVDGMPMEYGYILIQNNKDNSNIPARVRERQNILDAIEQLEEGKAPKFITDSLYTLLWGVEKNMGVKLTPKERTKPPYHKRTITAQGTFVERGGLNFYFPVGASKLFGVGMGVLAGKHDQPTLQPEVAIAPGKFRLLGGLDIRFDKVNPELNDGYSFAITFNGVHGEMNFSFQTTNFILGLLNADVIYSANEDRVYTLNGREGLWTTFKSGIYAPFKNTRQARVYIGVEEAELRRTGLGLGGGVELNDLFNPDGTLKAKLWGIIIWHF